MRKINKWLAAFGVGLLALTIGIARYDLDSVSAALSSRLQDRFMAMFIDTTGPGVGIRITTATESTAALPSRINDRWFQAFASCGAGQTCLRVVDVSPAAGGAPIDAEYITVSLNGTLTDERALAGTADQVILTDGGAGGSLTLSLPQSIALTSSPSFTNLNITNRLNHTSDLDTFIDFNTDEIEIEVGGTFFTRLTEGAADVFTINPNAGDVDFIVETALVADALTIDAGADTAAFNVPLTTNNILFEADSTYDIGTVTVRAQHIYTDDITVGGASIGLSDTGLAADVFLKRDGANVLALRNGTNMQTLHIYNTFTDASNYERGKLYFDASNVYTMETQAAGTGSDRSMRIGTTGSSGNLIFQTANTDRISIAGATGNMLFSTDNSWDIGNSSTTFRPRNIFAGTLVSTPTLNLLNSTNQIVLDSDAVNTGTITMEALTASRTWTFPNKTGTVTVNGSTVLNESATDIAVSNTVVETTIYTFSIPANTLGTSSRLRLHLAGQYTNTTSGYQASTVRLKYGATTLATGTLNLTEGESGEGAEIVATLNGDGATGSQLGSLRTHAGRDAIPDTTTEVSATLDTTTTSSTDVLMSGMTITPVAGDYLVWFSTSVENSLDPEDQFISIYTGGSQVAASERQMFTEGSIPGTSMVMATQAFVTVNGAQAIEGRWRTTGGTATAHERTLTIKRIVEGDQSDSERGTSAEDSTGALTLAVTIEHPTASASLSYTMEHAQLEHLLE